MWRCDQPNGADTAAADTLKLAAEPKMDNTAHLRTILLICLALAMLISAVYGQAVRFHFVNFDDDRYVYNNPMVLAGLSVTGLRQAFFFSHSNWHPLTWISLMADTQLGKWLGLNEDETGRVHAGVYHCTNVLLHLANVLLLFALLLLSTGQLWKSVFVAAVFAIHPLHVESVAWVTERKDVLSTLFWLATTIAYVRYVRAPALRRYLPIVFFYILGLMSKPMLVTLPLTLLLLDFWPLRRFHHRPTAKNRRPVDKPEYLRIATRLFLEKLPLFALAAGSCVLTVMAQQRGPGPITFSELSLGTRLANAAVSAVQYVRKMFWPTNLACFYPHPDRSIPTWAVVASAIVLAVITTFAIHAARHRPYITVGWSWFLITLLPVSGLVQVGWQQMADRYSYIPNIGLYTSITWTISELAARLHLPIARRASTAVAVAVICTLAVHTYYQVGCWRNSITLMSHAIKVTRANFLAHNNLGLALVEQGNLDAGIYHFRKSLEYKPDYVLALYNLGTYTIKSDPQGAEVLLRKTIEISPRYAKAYSNLGIILAQKNDLDGAIEYFRRALSIDPSLVQTRINLQTALELKKRQTADE